MTSIKKLLTLGLAIMFVLNACTIEKRKHLAGYNIEWNRSVKTASKTQPVQQVKSLEQVQPTNLTNNNFNFKTQPNPVDESLVASINEKQILPIRKEKIPVAILEQKRQVEKFITAPLAETKSLKENKTNAAGNVQSKTQGSGAKGLIYKLIALFGIGFLIKKLNKIIKQNKLKAGPEKKKKNIGLLILIIVLLVVAMALALSTLLAV